MAIRMRVKKIFFWLGVAFLSLVAAVIGFAYSYVTDSATLAELIRQEAPRFFQNGTVLVDRVQMRLLLGEVTMNRLVLVQRVDGRLITVLRIPWLNIKSDLTDAFHGRVQPRRIVVAQPTLRVCQRADGSWNLSGLLADPWPGPVLPVQPAIEIRSGRVELVDDRGETKAVLLRDVALRVEPMGEGAGPLHFEGSAEGDAAFGRMQLEGTFDHRTGRLEVTKGSLMRLAVTETFGRRLPAKLRTKFARLGLTGGEIDISLQKLSYDPAAQDPITALQGRLVLRDGAWNCPNLPFDLNDVSGWGAFTKNTITIDRLDGQNGKTQVRMKGTLSAEDPRDALFDVTVGVSGLELDGRLRKWTPAEFAPLWREFQPRGWVNLAIHAVRRKRGEEPAFGMTVSCEDVAMRYFRFPYQLEHIRGTLVWSGPTIEVNLQTILGEGLVTATGTIENPGPDSIVQLTFSAESLPVNETFMKALPPEVLEVVQQFNPSGSVRGTADLYRTPPPSPDKPENVAITAKIDLNQGCSMRWDGLPYPITDLTGHLELYPDHWVFQGMKGRNGTATIEADGEVRQVSPKLQSVELSLRAKHLPFDKQLHDALPKEWQVSWDTLKPTGSSNVVAQIQIEAGEEPHYHLKIDPEPDSRIRLTIRPVPLAQKPGLALPDVIQMPPMENIKGTFVFDDGKVTMSDVAFVFREARVDFKAGTVVVEQNGAFDLNVANLAVHKLRLDTELRKIMPPVMAQFAQKLDDGRPFTIRTNMHIGWSGKAGKPAEVDWNDALVLFNDNSVLTGLPLQHIQGQLDHVKGRSDGQSLWLEGAMYLNSIYLLGQQVTELTSPIEVKDGTARMTNIRGTILGGEVTGDADVSLDASPEYHAHLKIRDADLHEYAMAVPGHQQMRGRVSGWLNLSGLGNSLGTLSGEGQAQMTAGDLGQLPLMLRWVKATNFKMPSKTAFNSANLGIRIQNGIAILDPIKFTGDAFSLMGSGTLDLAANQELDLHLSPLYGRDDLHVPVLSDVMREASGKVFDIHVSGPASAPNVRSEALPSVLPRLSDALRRSNQRRAERRGRESGSASGSGRSMR